MCISIPAFLGLLVGMAIFAAAIVFIPEAIDIVAKLLAEEEDVE